MVFRMMNFSLVVSKVKNSPENVVDMHHLVTAVNNGKVSATDLRNVYDQVAAGKFVDVFKVTTLQDSLNTLLPGIMPLLLLFIVLWLLRKKVNPIWIIFGLFAVGILAFWGGVMS